MGRLCCSDLVRSRQRALGPSESRAGPRPPATKVTSKSFSVPKPDGLTGEPPGFESNNKSRWPCDRTIVLQGRVPEKH